MLAISVFLIHLSEIMSCISSTKRRPHVPLWHAVIVICLLKTCGWSVKPTKSCLTDSDVQEPGCHGDSDRIKEKEKKRKERERRDMRTLSNFMEWVSFSFWKSEISIKLL